jgi:hypothetical protein
MTDLLLWLGVVGTVLFVVVFHSRRGQRAPAIAPYTTRQRPGPRPEGLGAGHQLPSLLEP